MAIKADYLITGVDHDANDKHIEKVRIAKVTNGCVGTAMMKPREYVANLITQGKKVATARKKPNGDFAEGEDVHIFHINGKDYLRTDKNKGEKDNLEKLPEL